MDKRSRIRSLIAQAGSRFATVTFLKKDGTERVMTVQPRVTSYIKGEDASPSARQGAITRAINNPHLMNVYDAVKKAPRSIDLDTVRRVALNGQVYDFA